MTIRLHRGDLPDQDLTRYAGSAAIDTETMGLNPHRDRLCVVQMSPGDGSADVIQIAKGQRDAQNLKAKATGDRAKSEAMLKAMEADGTRVKPEFGSVWYHFSGPDKDRISPHHMTIAVPGATGASLGVPENGRSGTVWIMNPGTTTAHLMIPGQ